MTGEGPSLGLSFPAMGNDGEGGGQCGTVMEGEAGEGPSVTGEEVEGWGQSFPTRKEAVG